MEPTCPKCRTRMEEGFIVDHIPGGGAPPEWAKGPLEKSFWTGVKLSGKERRPIKTYRCPGCGLLESYAGESAG